MISPAPVLTVTLNPAVDKSLFCRGALSGDNVRAHRTVDLAGGKGLNVSRGLHALGVESRALALLGGHSGGYLRELLVEQGVAPIPVPIAGVTRLALTLLEEETGEYLHVLEPGPAVSEEEAASCLAAFAAALPETRLAIISGSVPHQALAWLPAEMVSRAVFHRVPVWLDTSGEALLRGVAARPTLLKPNRAEAEALTGCSCTTLDGALAALDRIVALGRRHVVLSLGAEGIVAAWDGLMLRAWSPPADERCAIGSGDALVAGMATAALEEAPAEEILRWGVACGAANAETWLPTEFTREAAEAWLTRVVVEQIA